jgi:DNA-binding NtrC family response regulator
MTTLGEMSGEKMKVLLLGNPSDHFEKLEGVLGRLGITMVRVYRLAEAERFLTRTNAPWLIFTDTMLADGDWTKALDLAARAPNTARVIVVSRLADDALYLDTLERGAEDFIVAPFAADDVAHAVRGAILHESIRPRPQQHAAVA